MATPPFNPSETVPADNAIVAQYPTAERSFRDIMESWMLIDHNDLGQHKHVELSNIATDPVFPASVWGIYNNNGKMNARFSNQSGFRVVLWPLGTKTLFMNAAVPAGWTLDVTALDRAVLVGNPGGVLAGSWTISGMTVGAHTLTVNEMPSHVHGGGRASNIDAGTSAGAPGDFWRGSIVPTDAQGGGAAHDHPISSNASWRPLYISAVIGTLD